MSSVSSDFDLAWASTLSSSELHQLAVEAMNPNRRTAVRLLNTHALDDRTWYSLKLSDRLADCYHATEQANQGNPLPNPLALPAMHLKVQQAYHLIEHGTPIPIDRSDRLVTYGDDEYIAARLVQMLRDPQNCKLWRDFLWRIGSNANQISSLEPLNDEAVTRVLEFVQRRWGLSLKLPDSFSLISSNTTSEN